MNIPVKYPRAWKTFTALAGIAAAIAAQPQLTLREVVAMVGALFVGGGAVSVTKRVAE